MKKNVLTKSLFAALLLASTVVAAEEQYPAADFQPTVIYSDATATGAEASTSEATASEDKSEATAEKEGSSNTMLFGLVILAVAGGFFLSQKPKCKTKKAAGSTSSYSGEASGLTGVEKYLQGQSSSAATGVEKYLAQKEVADKEAAQTGVDKYLRNRG